LRHSVFLNILSQIRLPRKAKFKVTDQADSIEPGIFVPGGMRENLMKEKSWSWPCRGTNRSRL
jgi:hypothetical protein